jgi:hypothetical protein
MQLVEQIINSNGQIMAIIISHRFNEKGIHFFTPDEFSQQLAYMNHPKGKIIDPHYHNAVQRNVVFTQEVLIIKKGKLKRSGAFAGELKLAPRGNSCATTRGLLLGARP